MKNIALLLLMVGGCSLNLFSQKTLTNFLRTEKPQETPQLYGPDVVSTHLPNRDFTTSPDGLEIFYTIQNTALKFSTILCIKKVGTEWTMPQVATFSGVYSDLEPFISPDGKKLFFASNRPLDPTQETKDYDLWVCTKSKDGKWGSPTHLGNNINTNKDEFYPSVSLNGNLYFTATREEGQGKEDIYVSNFNQGTYELPKPLNDSINTSKYEFNAYIAPDESFIIFSSFGREDDLGGGDLYYALKGKDNNWLGAVNFNTPINSSFLDYCPYVDVKNNVLYFTSNRHNHKLDKKPLNTKSLKGTFDEILNGLDNLYWVNLPAKPFN